MARGKKTGGRNFTKGHGHGRPKGSKDRVPRSFKASLKALYERLLSEEQPLCFAVIKRDVKKGGLVAFQHLKLAAFYLDGPPSQRVEVSDPNGQPLTFTLKIDDDE